MDRAATLLTAINKKIIEYKFRVNKDGTIFEIDARNTESKVTDYLMADLKSNIVGLVVQVDRSINLLQSQTLKITASILPYGYAKFLNLIIGFTPVVRA
jgi:hypothetical protein